MTLLLWMVDSLIIYFKKLNKLRIDNIIFFDDIEISPRDILKITPVTDKRHGWTFKTIQFEIRRNNMDETISILEKPTWFIEDLMKKQSKTLKLLFNEFPELKNKLTSSIVK